MSGQPAARFGDKIACATPQATPAALPHAPTGSPIVGTCALAVEIGGKGKRAARMGDFSLCPSPVPVPNNIMRGAFPVPIEQMPAARMTDSGTAPHVGMIIPPCCPTVLIGLAGTTGNVVAGTAACQALSNGRTSGTQNQSYNNCGIESSRQLINHSTPANVSEDALMQTAKNTPSINTGGGIGASGGANLFAEGGTVPSQQASLLTNSGVPSSVVPAPATGATVSQFELPLSQGKGVLSGGDVSGMPPRMGYTGGGGHAVTVTGLDYDDAGNVTNVHYNDTNGMCGSTMTTAEFQNFMNAESNSFIANGWTPFGTVVTNNPVW